jgi:hypothetical protein
VLTQAELDTFRALAADMVAVHGSPFLAANKSGISHSSLRGLLGPGKEPWARHIWGLAKGLDTTPEAIVAKVRGVELPTGGVVLPLLDRVDHASLREQLEVLGRIASNLQADFDVRYKR